MSWITGSSDDYRDLSDDILAAVLATSADSVDSIAAVGTGYVVGDLITLTGGTFTVATILEVVTLSGSGVASARIFQAGIYSVAPGDPVAQGSTDGVGVNATFNMTYSSNGWTQDRDTGDGISVIDSVASGGSGYAVNDIITLAGGTFTVPAQLKVTAETGGVIDAGGVSIETAGVYSAIPADSVVQDSTDGSGIGATFDLTWEAGERQVIIHGSGSGSDSIYVGWRTYSNVGAQRFNWELHGMTGYDANLSIVSQAGVNPGDNEHATATVRYGAYLPLNNGIMNWWMSVTPLRIILFVKVGSNYFSMYLGFINRFATSTEFPYPLLVSGSTDLETATPTQTEKMSALTFPWATTTILTGPMHLLTSSGIWVRFACAAVSSGFLGQGGAKYVTPLCGVPADANIGSQEDRFSSFSQAASFDNIVNWDDLNPPLASLHPTPGTTDVYVMFPTELIFSDGPDDQQIYGEVDDVFWFSAFGGVANENRLIQDGVAYRVFQNCNNLAAHQFIAVKEG